MSSFGTNEEHELIKRFLYAGLLIGAAVPTFANDTFAGDLGISIAVDQPGVYGRVDIGNVRQTQVIYAQPVVATAPPPTLLAPAPIYLHVPPGHEKHWRKHCHEYGACGQSVYFVQDRWYHDVYVPAQREHRDDHDHHQDEHRDHDSRDHEKHHGHGHDKYNDHGE
jgi:hypothetical protein